jgi:hypothetical protein
MPISAPDKIITPWATSGLKTTIPEAADPINGRAGFDQGFPAINLTPKTAGGIPPFGQDFNGIFFDVTQALQFMQAGGTFPYDSAWAAAVGGYPAGALVSRTDNQGLWRNTVANNLTNPEAGGAGWQPEGSGLTSVAMTSTNVTLTALQAAREIIVITGTLTANLQLIFPAYVKQWQVINETAGSFTVNCKTAAGSGVSLRGGQIATIVGDGSDITGMDFSSVIASAGWQRFPSGLILQWGTVAPLPQGGSLTFTYPLALPNAVFQVIASSMSSGNNTFGYTVSSFAQTLSNVGISNNSATSGVATARILVIGH